VTASQLKVLIGAIMAIAGVAASFVPDPYKTILITVIGLAGGAHTAVSASSTDVKT
jgi:hypothetical protein